MQTTALTLPSADSNDISTGSVVSDVAASLTPFEQVKMTITKAELIEFKHRIKTLEGQYRALQKKNEELEAENQRLKAELRLS